MKIPNHFFTLIAIVSTQFICQTANADLTVEFRQENGNVVATTTGNLDFTGLSSNSGTAGPSAVRSGGTYPLALIGAASTSQINLYSGAINVDWATTFGTGSYQAANSTSGMMIGQGHLITSDTTYLFVDENYVAGTEINSQSTWNNETIQSLGMKRGTYTTSWASDSITMHVVPEPGSASILIGGIVGLLRLRRRRI